jgi:hypothetical protein
MVLGFRLTFSPLSPITADWQMQKAFTTGSLVISIHDVSPSTCKRSQEILGDLGRAGIDATSLLVIPNHHHRGLISDDPEFATWIREKVAEGHEAVLHGFYHLREKQNSDGTMNRLITQSYTAGEGEFFDPSHDRACKLLQSGRAAFAACGLEAKGFIAPAWLLGAEAEAAVKQECFEYTTRIATVSDFTNGRVYQARSLVWSVRARWRRICSLAWNHSLFMSFRNAPLLRIGIHPPDWDYPAIRSQILHLASTALARRQAMTYQHWLEIQRLNP